MVKGLGRRKHRHAVPLSSEENFIGLLRGMAVSDGRVGQRIPYLRRKLSQKQSDKEEVGLVLSQVSCREKIQLACSVSENSKVINRGASHILNLSCCGGFLRRLTSPGAVELPRANTTQ